METESRLVAARSLGREQRLPARGSGVSLWSGEMLWNEVADLVVNILKNILK